MSRATDKEKPDHPERNIGTPYEDEKEKNTMQTDKFSLPEGILAVHVIRTINHSIKEVFDCLIDADVSHLFPRRGDIAGFQQQCRRKIGDLDRNVC